MEKFSTTTYQELLKPEVFLVGVVLGNKFEELLCAWWAFALYEVVLFECEHLTLGKLLTLKGDVPRWFVFHGDSPELMTVTEEVRNGDNVPEYTPLFRPIRALQTVFLAGRLLIM